MRRILSLVFAFIALNTFAQKSNIESAAIYLRNSEIEDAKKAIDIAVEHPDTKNDPKMWFYRVAVYDSIYRNPAHTKLDKEVLDKWYDACKNCLETDVKKRYENECRLAFINSAFGAFNKGIEEYDSKNYSSAIAYYKKVLAVLPYDVNKDLAKNNLSEKTLYLYMTYASVQAEDKASAKEYLQKLMDLDYQDQIIYIQMSALYLEDKDTTNALKYVELGRQKFPSEKDLINQELNIYLAMGKRDVLLKKLNEVIENDPENFNLLYVRGNVYDNFGVELTKKFRTERDSAAVLTKKLNSEKDPAKKKRLQDDSKKLNNSSIESYNLAKTNISKAEEDYIKVIRINPDYIDAYFNMGAISNNRTTDVVEKMNAITAYTTADYNKRFAPLKKIQDSILNVALGYFSDALKIAESKSEDTPEKKKEKKMYMNDILFSMQQVYANLGDEKKTMEMKKRREDLGK